MMKKEEMETFKFVKTNQALFDDVQRKYDNPYDANKEYTIINYRRFLNDMCDYLEGYLDYCESNTRKYGNNQILAKSAKFYDSMFHDKRYRTTITLGDFSDITEDFLEGTRDLQEILVRVEQKDEELHAMVVMTNNQYRKLSRVFHDDHELWFWLRTGKREPSAKLRQDYKNKSTPVMHKK